MMRQFSSAGWRARRSPCTRPFLLRGTASRAGSYVPQFQMCARSQGPATVAPVIGHLVRTKPSTMMAGRWMARGAHRARVGPAAGLALLLRRCRACCRESTSMDLPLPLVARRPHGDQCSNTARSSSGLVSIQTHCADFHTDLYGKPVRVELGEIIRSYGATQHRTAERLAASQSLLRIERGRAHVPPARAAVAAWSPRRDEGHRFYGVWSPRIR